VNHVLESVFVTVLVLWAGLVSTAVFKVTAVWAWNQTFGDKS
jgi:hypothetical protein